jgi:NADH:ubiquinone oxidoreductase subunit 5 (subunit L)/multisubunit Na+/H+ antiporter MnhA subunit
VGCLTMLMAGLRATQEMDIKKIVALSTLRQLGLIITCLGLGQ